MRKSPLLIFSFLLSILFSTLTSARSQPPYSGQYFGYIAKARGYRSQTQYRLSGLYYDSAFQSAGGHGRPADLYDAACAWALAHDTEHAFTDLYQAVRQGKWARPEEAAKDEDLTTLTTDKRWSDVLERMKVNKMEREGKFDRALQDTLNRIYTTDQSGRLAIDSIQKRFGNDSKQMDSLWESISRDDSVNLMCIRGILARRSWPSPDEVGERASMAVFLVIQHSDSLTHATFLPMMQAAVQRGAARPEDLALLQDRLLTEQGKPQIYGSQVKMDPKGKAMFFPIADEPNVDKRRASVGLEPLESYARYFGIDYHLPAP
ncbi:MAG TPA: DUF6624 domain-containing protein [Puia sp.]|jgi:hypothetical protein|nr:DUF6624 domain-containing protein [Puia sp.]